MKKLLLSLLLGAAFIPAFADEPATTEFSYCQSDNSIYMGDGLVLTYDANVGVAIRIPHNALSKYNGGRIVGFKFGAADGSKDHEIHAFLRQGSLTGENVASTTDYVSFEKFNGYYGALTDVLFDKGWTIPENLEEDMFLGLYTSQPANKHIIGIAGNTQTAPDNSVFIAETDNLSITEPDNWIDIKSVVPYGNNVALKAIIELPSENYSGALQIVDAFMPNICPVGTPTNVYFFLRNDGTTPISSFELTLKYGEETASKTITIDGNPMPLGFESNNRSPIKIPVNVLGTGKHTLSITKVNGEENNALEKDSSVDFDLIGVPAQEAMKHIRRPLYEYYCSETDYQSGINEKDAVIPSLQDFKGRVTYLPQHTSDKFAQNPIDTPAFIEGENTTIELSDADRWAIKLSSENINMVKIPSACIDRVIKMENIELSGKNTVDNPICIGTPYPQANAYFMPEALNTPTFASVELENEFNPETHIATIKASGTIADLLPEGEKAKLSIFVVEETIWSESQEFPETSGIEERFPGGMFDHYRVVRETITDFWGETLEPGSDFVKTFSVELDNPAWNTDHMLVIAVIQRPETNHFLKMDVLNTAEEPLTQTYKESYGESGISQIETSRPVGGGIFDLQGRRLTTPVRGINIINGKKILVK